MASTYKPDFTAKVQTIFKPTNKKRKKMKAIWKLDLDFGRDGKLTGIFVAEKEDLAAIDGEVIYFGDALGKYSAVKIYFDFSSDVKMVTDSTEAVAMFEKYDMGTGYDPLAYLDPE